MKKIFFTVFLFLLLCGRAFATTYYASPSGGGAASCVDNGANVCSLQRAITVAAGGNNTIEMSNGSYNCSTSCNFTSTNTGATLTLKPAAGATVTVSSTGANYVFDIQSSMVSGNITFDNVGISETNTTYGVANRTPEVNVTVKNSAVTNSGGSAVYEPIDTTNLITLVSGEDTVTNLKTGATTNVKVAQKFVVGGSNITVNRASFKMKRRCGNKGTNCDQFVSGESWDYRNGDTLTVTIETDSAGAPSGTPVTNGTAQTLLAYNVPYISDEWISFKFSSNVSLTASTTYWLVITGSYSASSTNYIELDTDTGDGYGSGDSATYNGTSWSAASAGTDLLFTIDRAHTRNLTISGNTFNTSGTNILAYWDDTVTVDSNSLTSTSGGILSLAANNQWTTSDDQHKRIVLSNNTLSNTAGGTTQMMTVGTQTFAKTYTNSIIVYNNTGIVNIFSQPYEYVRKLFIYGNNLEVQYSGNVPFKFGKEVDGSDPMELPYHPFDQIVLEKNTFNFSSVTHNHLFLMGIGSENGVFINNTIKAPNGSGSGGGGWGIVLKADNWNIVNNRFYGPGPAVYPTSNYHFIYGNTFETYDSTGSNAAILFRSHQDQIYGGNHGIPKYNFVENNIFISNGSSFAAMTHCDNVNCATASPSTLGTNRTEEFWSNRIDNNLYYARDNTSAHIQIGAGTSLENVTLAEGIATARTAWSNSTYSNSNSIAQYNDLRNSIIVQPTGISGSTDTYATRDPNIVGKGLWANQSIGAYTPEVGPEAVGKKY